MFITHAAFLLGAAQLFLVINFIGSWIWGRKSLHRNPWEATTLEWEIPQPAAAWQFSKNRLVVYHGSYEYASPLVEEDYLLQTRYVEGAAEVGARSRRIEAAGEMSNA